MKRGITKRSITKVVMVGTAGSGKSTSLQTVMDEKPPAEEDRESTPLLTRPVQTEVIYIDKNVKWVKKTPEQKKRYIANLLRVRAQRLSEESPTASDAASPSTPTPTPPASDQPPPVQPPPDHPTASTATSDQPSPLQSTPVRHSRVKQYVARFWRPFAQRLGKKSANHSASPTTDHSPPDQRLPDQPTASTLQSSTASQPTKTSATTPTSAAATATAGRSSGAPSEGTLESLLQSSEVDDEFISLINIPSDSSETILTERVVYIVDSGGQPEFVEAMAVFLGKTSACILVIDLSQSLDHHALIGYYRKGKAVSKPYRCIRTNEENLKQCMRNFATITSKSKGPLTKLLLLGTHLDRIHECDTETVADKNARLKKIIPPQFEKQVIRVDDKTLIFEINALNPNDTDKKTAEKVRSYIMEQCPAVEVEIPMRWHAFEEKLRSLAESLGRMVMSRNECWLVAESLGLDEASFDGALDFFHRVSLMFYFHDILPHIVFIDPQVMLDKVSELIEFMFELREPKDEDESTPDTTPAATTSSGAAASTPKELPVIPSTTDVDLLPPGWLEFNRFGHITKQFLNSKRFSSHYHTDIFTSDDLIHLLEEVLVFAKLSTDEGPDTWFMPSVLKQVSAVKMGEVCVSAGPLVVNFPDGGPQNGIFCSLMSHVLSPLNLHPCPWKLHLASNEPTCLYRDCIKFQVPKYAGSVTLIDRYEFFEVHVFTSEEEMQELWQHTQNAIFSGITTVRDTLGYSNNKPHPAIICPNTTHTDKTHPAYIKNEKWICTSDSCVFGKLRDLNTDFHWCGVTCELQVLLYYCLSYLRRHTHLPLLPMSSVIFCCILLQANHSPHHRVCLPRHLYHHQSLHMINQLHTH